MAGEQAQSDTGPNHARYRIIDANSQVQEQVDDLLGHMPAESAVRKVVAEAKLNRTPFAGGYSGYPDYDYQRSAGTQSPVLADREVTEPIGPEDTDEILESLDIDVGIVNPTMLLGLGEVNNRFYATTAASAYNRWLLDGLDETRSLVGNLVVAPHRPAQAAEEIDHHGEEDRIVGVTLPSVGADKPLGHERYSLIYDAASDAGLPISVHAPVAIKPYRNQAETARHYAELYAYQPSMSNTRELISLMFEGVPEFYPELSFVFHGGGLGWVPYAIYRIDDHYLQSPPDFPALSSLPSKHLTDNFYFTTHPMGTDPDLSWATKSVKMIGTDRVLFSSDVPHPITDTPDRLIKTLTGALNPTDVAGIMGNNAAQVYEL